MEMENELNTTIIDAAIFSVPACFFLIMSADGTSISIPELHLSFYSDELIIYGLILTVLLASSRPIRDLFSHSVLLTALYGLLPVLLYFILYLAQQKFRLTVCLLILCLLPVPILVHQLYKDDKLSLWSHFLIGVRVFLVSIYAFLSIPATVTGIRFMKDAKPITPTVSVSIVDETEAGLPRKEDLIAEHEAELLQLREWDHLDVLKRVDLLQLVSSIETAALGIPPVSISSKLLDEPGLLAYYDADEQSITVNLRHLLLDTAEDNVSTVAHEVYHSLQWYIVLNLDFEDPFFSRCAYFRQAVMWKTNFDHYASGLTGTFDSYYAQVVEADARDYAETAFPQYFIWKTDDASDEASEVDIAA